MNRESVRSQYVFKEKMAKIYGNLAKIITNKSKLWPNNEYTRRGSEEFKPTSGAN